MLKEFEINNNNNKNWNDLVSSFDHLDYYSLSEWGNFKKKQGWTVKQFVFIENKNVKFAFQALLKNKYLIKLIWIPGGIIGNFNEKSLSIIIKTLKIKFGKNIVIRISFSKKNKQNEYNFLINSRFIKIDSKNYANSTMKLNLSSNDSLKFGLTKNWRHNLKRSFKYKNYILDYDEEMLPKLIQIYREMEEFKNINNFHDYDSLKFLLDHMKNLLIFKVCVNKNNNLLSFRCAIIFKSYAWDLLAGTSANGRRNYSSYFVTYEMLKECIKNNVKYFDFSGINKQVNKGVYNFKKGTGSKEFEKLGLWQYYRFAFLNKLLKYLIN